MWSMPTLQYRNQLSGSGSGLSALDGIAPTPYHQAAQAHEECQRDTGKVRHQLENAQYADCREY